MGTTRAATLAECAGAVRLANARSSRPLAHQGRNHWSHANRRRHQSQLRGGRSWQLVFSERTSARLHAIGARSFHRAFHRNRSEVTDTYSAGSEFAERHFHGREWRAFSANGTWAGGSTRR